MRREDLWSNGVAQSGHGLARHHGPHAAWLVEQGRSMRPIEKGKFGIAVDVPGVEQVRIHLGENSNYGHPGKAGSHTSTFAILASACSKLALEVANDSRT
jgi:hypothetical protein